MLFNSMDFAVFLPLVFAIYWGLFQSRLKLQNLFLVAASYFFYGWWDVRFLSLIVASSLIDYAIGIGLSSTDSTFKRKALLFASIGVNLGLLGVFKYFDFFSTSFADAYQLFGHAIDPLRLNLVLPIGISFYTFQTLSYSIDVYKKNLEPCKDIVAFLGFVSFFPQLVAGPIERATNLLPQFYQSRSFNYSKAIDGLKQILWGLFKKIVIADNCALFVNDVFSNNEALAGSTLLLGAIFFAFQIYGDFSGYSDIAIGTSRLFGFQLNKNFAFPYFSRDMAEFWRRWHISLSTWFRDYLYIPLGGSRGSLWFKIRNTAIIFLVSGFWHGANWTFIIWGLLNALYFLPLLLRKRNRANLDDVAQGRLFPKFEELLKIMGTFGLTVIAWVFFRAESVSHAIAYLDGICSFSIFYFPENVPLNLILFLIVFIALEWLGRSNEYAIQRMKINTALPMRWAVYLGITICIFSNINNSQDFIYFQF